LFIVSITYTSDLIEIDKHLDEHVIYLDKQYKDGNFLISGRKEPRTGGVIISTVSSRNGLNEILRQDPFYREKLADYDITEIVPTKASSELEHLLSV
jgi:uncharacterized protein YciI